MKRTFMIFVAAAAMLLPAFAQQNKDEHVLMVERINRVTGFNQERVVRHFFLLKNGGAMEVIVKDASDADTLAAIQKHMKKTAELWTAGKFDDLTAMFGKMPDGVAQLKKLRDNVTFAAVPEENGCVLRMLTINPDAKAAIHSYLKSQIETLETGDPLEVPAD